MLLDSLAKFCHLHGRSEQVHLSAVKSADRSVIHISSKTFKNPLELPDYHFFFGVMEFPAFIFPLERKQNVNTPTLPINIKTIKTILLNRPSSSVIPSDKPTVPKADVTSKRICIMENDSVAAIINTETKINAITINVTVTAFNKSSGYTSRLNRRMLSPPRAYVMIKMTTSANVVVRMPPPALLGDAPMNIRNDMNRWFASLKILTSIVDRPPLLVVTD